jgi:arylsulfatase A
MQRRTITLGVLLLASAFAEKPNIVFIMADDMGYGDVQALNPRSKIPTPHLNGLAAEGMTFTDAHSNSAVCTPTRYGVVTGRYAWRTRMKGGVLNGYSGPLIDPGRQTVAGLLKGAGYHTACIGKWHLGLGWVKDGKRIDFTRPLTSTPNDNGFDYWYGIPASLDFPPYVFIRNRSVTDPEWVEQAAEGFPAYLRKGERSKALVMENALHDLTADAVKYIGEQVRTAAPFFLYFPLTAPHKPVLPHPDFRGKSPAGPYGDFVMQVDWTVGQVLGAIDRAGISEKTLVMYTSDNGSFMHRKPGETGHLENPGVQAFRPETHTANGVLRGTKADIYEAGHRVPFFARWPGKVVAGSTCNATITHPDLFRTCAEITGARVAKGAGPDSASFYHHLQGRSGPEREPVIHHSAGGMFSIRSGKWKMILGNGSGGRAQPKGKKFKRPYQLYDLSTDLAEATDLASQYPEVVKELEAACLKIKGDD